MNQTPTQDESNPCILILSVFDESNPCILILSVFDESSLYREYRNGPFLKNFLPFFNWIYDTRKQARKWGKY